MLVTSLEKEQGEKDGRERHAKGIVRGSFERVIKQRFFFFLLLLFFLFFQDNLIDYHERG